MTFVKPSQLAKETGLPYSYILQLCRTPYGRANFAYPSKTDEKGRCIGVTYINKEKFLDAYERGLLTE